MQSMLLDLDARYVMELRPTMVGIAVMIGLRTGEVAQPIAAMYWHPANEEWNVRWGIGKGTFLHEDSHRKGWRGFCQAVRQLCEHVGPHGEEVRRILTRPSPAEVVVDAPKMRPEVFNELLNRFGDDN